MPKLKTLRPRFEPKKERTESIPQLSRWGTSRGGRPWRRLKKAVHDRDLWTCQADSCGYIGHELECVHIVPKSQGGEDNMENLQSLCVPCHAKKTAEESKAGRGLL